MYDEMEGRVAVVTGAASGMGRASAIAFAREGAKVALADWDAEGGAETEAMIRDAGGDAFFVQTDVSQSADVARFFDETLVRFGDLDYAHNNAGIGGPTDPVDEISEDDWDQVQGINLRGIWLCLKREIAYMKRHGGGAIVNTASNVGLIGIPGAGAYVAAKHGVVGLTKAAALEYALSGIRVNCVCPGVVDTPMVERALGGSEDARQWMLNLVPMRRMAAPEEVAAAVLWLCSSGASFVNGHPLTVDAGQVWTP